ncbi:unnamed protein product [Bemisia tabaci]|uniref:Uncharacterized protein n=1 Tax=Bemisia tabaci TaxID=7038 RepID=A0AAI8UTT9_BEMTA|nr:unnamed protein product [Bemisia tabaci]
MFGPWFSTSCSLFLLFVLFVGQKNSVLAFFPGRPQRWDTIKCQEKCFVRDGFFKYGDTDLLKPVSNGVVRYGGFWCSCPSTPLFKDYLKKHNLTKPKFQRFMKLIYIGYGKMRLGDLRSITFYSGKDVMNILTANHNAQQSTINAKKKEEYFKIDEKTGNPEHITLYCQGDICRHLKVSDTTGAGVKIKVYEPKSSKTKSTNKR